jgi:2-succinyl-6-hydroxy-2,4-cyclohexadiene-1-carboxylate synthase
VKVVFVHGFLGSPSEWETVSGELGPDFEAVHFAIPELGRYSIADLAEALERETRELGPSHYVGYSMGGRIVLALYRSHPERFTSLVLESVNPGIEAPDEREVRFKRDCDWAELFETDAPAFYARWYAQPLFALDPVPEALLEQRMRAHSQRDSKILVEASPGANPSLWSTLSAVRHPALYIAGYQDKQYSETAEKIRQRNPAIKARIFEGCGHNVHQAKPREYAAALREFLRSTS